MRGKRIPLAQLGRVLEHGLPLCDVFWVMHVDESDLVARPEGHEGYFPTEPTATPTSSPCRTCRPRASCRGIADTVLFLCDWHLPHDGGPVPISPRVMLSRIIERSRALGYEPVSALEFEFYVLREKVGTLHHKRAEDLVPLQEAPSTYGVVIGSHQEDVGALIRARCSPTTCPSRPATPRRVPASSRSPFATDRR